MATAPKIALGAVVAAGLAGVLIWQAQKPTPAPVAKPKPSQAMAQPGIPAPESLAADLSPSAAPEAPSLTAAPPPAASGADFVVKTLEDGDKAMRLAIEAAGGLEALQALRSATYRHYALSGGVHFDGELLHDGARAVLLSQRDSGDEVGMNGAACWHKSQGVVAGCTGTWRVVLGGLRQLHEATLLFPLLEAPYRLTAASAGLIEGRLHNVLRFSVGISDSEVLVALDPSSHRLLSVELSTKEQPLVRVALEEPQGFAGARLASVRRIGVPDRDKRWQPFTQRVLEVKPGVDPARLKPLALTREVALAVGPRAALAVQAFDATDHNGFGPALDEGRKALALLDHEAQVEIYEGLGRPDSEATLGQGVQVWLQRRAGPDGGGAKLVVIPPEAKVATQVVRGRFPEVLGRFARFVGEVKAKGYTPGPGRPAVRFLGEPDPATGEVTFQMQLPLQ